MVSTVNRGASVETEEDAIRSLAVVFALRGGMGTGVNIVSGNFGNMKFILLFVHYFLKFVIIYLSFFICRFFLYYFIPFTLGCPPDRYGAYCTKHCKCMNGGSCDPRTGECYCTPGWSGRDCSKRM